jgi:hypothetical protein
MARAVGARVPSRGPADGAERLTHRLDNGPALVALGATEPSHDRLERGERVVSARPAVGLPVEVGQFCAKRPVGGPPALVRRRLIYALRRSGPWCSSHHGARSSNRCRTEWCHSSPHRPPEYVRSSFRRAGSTSVVCTCSRRLFTTRWRPASSSLSCRAWRASGPFRASSSRGALAGAPRGCLRFRRMGVDGKFLHAMGMASIIAGVVLLVLARVWPG